MEAGMIFNAMAAFAKKLVHAGHVQGQREAQSRQFKSKPKVRRTPAWLRFFQRPKRNPFHDWHW
jgi:hypothetical protein